MGFSIRANLVILLHSVFFRMNESPFLVVDHCTRPCAFHLQSKMYSTLCELALLLLNPEGHVTLHQWLHWANNQTGKSTNKGIHRTYYWSRAHSSMKSLPDIIDFSLGSHWIPSGLFVFFGFSLVNIQETFPRTSNPEPPTLKSKWFAG